MTGCDKVDMKYINQLLIIRGIYLCFACFNWTVFVGPTQKCTSIDAGGYRTSGVHDSEKYGSWSRRTKVTLKPHFCQQISWFRTSVKRNFVKGDRHVRLLIIR